MIMVLYENNLEKYKQLLYVNLVSLRDNLSSKQ